MLQCVHSDSDETLMKHDISRTFYAPTTRRFVHRQCGSRLLVKKKIGRFISIPSSFKTAQRVAAVRAAGVGGLRVLKQSSGRPSTQEISSLTFWESTNNEFVCSSHAREHTCTRATVCNELVTLRLPDNRRIVCPENRRTYGATAGRVQRMELVGARNNGCGQTRCDFRACRMRAVQRKG